MIQGDLIIDDSERTTVAMPKMRRSLGGEWYVMNVDGSVAVCTLMAFDLS